MLKCNNNCFKIFRTLSEYCALSCTTPAIGQTKNTARGHTPVMKTEVTKALQLKNGDTVLDMTFGAGGHSKSLLEQYPDLKIIALDRDPIACEFAKDLRTEYPNQITPLLGRFSELHELCNKNNIPLQSIDGVIFDLGASSMQMDTADRGFAISKLGPLDMRMDGDRDPESITAADIVNNGKEDELYKIFRIYGEEKYSRVLARSIVQARFTYKFKTTKDMADLVDLVCNQPRFDKLERRVHGATKVFQALRIFVNNELNELHQGLILANFYLKLGGRIAVLSYHSLEDRVVKSHFHGHLNQNLHSPPPSVHKNPILHIDKDLINYTMKPWDPINKKVITPQPEEVKVNPRSRSAKLRAAVKINQITN